MFCDVIHFKEHERRASDSSGQTPGPVSGEMAASRVSSGSE